VIVDSPLQMLEHTGTGRLTHVHQVVFYKFMKFQAQQLPRTAFPYELVPFESRKMAISPDAFDDFKHKKYRFGKARGALIVLHKLFTE